uniref:LAGLIDADG endonuclease n=1 Tax=Powellomyces hirtus TaxID=109895 RepID=A0A4P8NPX5_9FUNG|nr:LAGLIDADG endonuclease [Powellomyces hirtus]
MRVMENRLYKLGTLALLPIPVLYVAPLWGIILGDAHVTKFLPAKGTRGGKGKNSRLAFEYGAKNRVLAFSLYNILTTAGIKCSYPRLRHRLPDKRTGKVYGSYSFKASASPYFTSLRKLFYVETKPHATKTIPKNIASVFTSWDLAWWIMDDGSWTGAGVDLNCHSFSLADQGILCRMLKRNFGILAHSKVTSDQNKFVIYIPAAQIDKLRELVLPYMLSDYLYKLGL